MTEEKIEKGPAYGVPLIDTLPIGGGMKQQMASRADLDQVMRVCPRVVCAYEVLLNHYSILLAASEGGGDAHGHCESCDRPLGKDDTYTVDSEGICECAKCCVEDAGNAEGGTPDA